MDSVDILLFFYPITLAVFFLYQPRRAVLFFFSTKFSIDLFWDHVLFGNLTTLKISGLLFPVLCLSFFLKERPRFKDHPLLKLLFLLLAINILSGIWGYLNSWFLFFPIPHSPLSLAHILNWNLRFVNLAAAVLIVPLILNRPNDKRLLLRCFLLSTVLPCLISWYQFSSISIERMVSRLSDPYSVSIFERIIGAYHDAGTLALVMFTAIICCAALFIIETSKGLRITVAFYAIACSVILYFTFSRTLWISITLFLILFFLIQKKKVWMITVLTIAAVIIFMAPLTMKRFEREIFFFKNPEQISEQSGIHKIGAGRLWLWNDAGKHFLNLDIVSKIIGSGGSFGSHNQYIAWLLRNGIIGLAVWLFFLYTIFILVLRHIKSKMITGPFPALTIILFCTITFVTNMATQPWDNLTFVYLFWSIIGLYVSHMQLEIHPPGKTA